MTYAIIAGNTIIDHGPANVLWPDALFPTSGPNADFLIEAGAVLIRSDAPYDPETEVLQPAEPYLLGGMVYNTVAAPMPAPPPPTPQWVAFGAVLLADPAINQMLGTALTTAPAVAMSISVGLGKAADGDDRVFRVSWAGAQSLGLISAELVEHVQAMAAAYNLPPDFIAALAPATP